MRRGILVTGILAVALFNTAYAAEQPIDLRANPHAEQLSEIRQTLRTEKYAELSDEDRRTVLQLLEQMEMQLQDGGAEALNGGQRVRLFNIQEQANSILIQAAEDSRLVCRRERKTGSRFKTTHCATVAERREVRERTQQELREMPRQHARPPSPN
ncbi:hypothetical protein [Lysobacter sp. D1-1-M9]|uniref:hypothetical protein n=2 Tax=Novilysobacter TaxID=3382699 RepID=UPI002FCCB66B